MFVFSLTPSAFAHDPLLRVAAIPGAGFDTPIYAGFNNEAVFEVQNTTNHPMRDMKFELKGNIPSGMGIDWWASDTTCVRGGTINANDACHLEIKFAPTQAGSFTGAYIFARSLKDDVRGARLIGFINGTAIAANTDVITHTETDLPYSHLAYRAIVAEHKVQPTGPGSGLTATIAGGLTDGIQATVCWNASSSADCEIYGDSNSYVNFGLPTPLCTSGGPITQGSKCHFWVRALKNEPSGLGPQSGTVEVKYNDDVVGNFSANYSQDLYASGSFTQTGAGLTVNSISKWDGSSWKALNNGAVSGIGFGFALGFALTTFNGDLYVGGNFTSPGGHAINNIARWTGDDWDSLPSGYVANNGVGSANALATLNGNLYVGGNFFSAGPPPGNAATDVAEWDGTSWSALIDSGTGGNGVEPGELRAMTTLSGKLYVGGDFTQAGGKTAPEVAEWDGSVWSAISQAPTPPGPLGSISALTTFSGNLYAGGSVPFLITNVATWNGAFSWTDLPSGGLIPNYGLSNTGSFADVFSMASDNNNLYVGGVITDAGNGVLPLIPTSNIAKWNGSAWSALPGASGEGVNNLVEAITTFDGDVYVGGGFTTADSGTITANYVAKWNISTPTWSQLSTGLGGEVIDLTVSPSITLTPSP